MYKAKQLEGCIFVSLLFPIGDVISTKIYDVKGFQKNFTSMIFGNRYIPFIRSNLTESIKFFMD